MNVDSVLDDLKTLTGFGPRFHGSPGIALAAEWLQKELERSSLVAQPQRVSIPGWAPGVVCRVNVTQPYARDIRSWPMLWSGRTNGPVEGSIIDLGQQGLWGDSMIWHRFLVKDSTDTIVGYLHSRDDGPAAPQPLPSGSDLSLPHFAIGRLDGLQICEWLADGFPVSVTIENDSQTSAELESDNLIVDIPGTGQGRAVICAHYDTFWNTVGAYDNGSGTLALLHLARRLVAEPPERSIRLIFFTAEEWHLSGSRAYVSASSIEELDEFDFVWNIDGLGSGDFLEVFAGPESFEATFTEAVRIYASQTRPSLKLASRFPPTLGTDDAAFFAAGVPTGFFTFNNLHKLHQPNDLPNRGIAENIVWTVSTIKQLMDLFPRPTRWTVRQLL